MSISGLGFPPSTGVVPHLFKSPSRSRENWEGEINNSVTSLMFKHTLMIKFWAPHSDKRSQAYELCEATLADFYRQCCKTSSIMRRYIEKAPFRREFLVPPGETLKGVLFNCRLLIGWLTPSWSQPVPPPAELANIEQMLAQLTALIETTVRTRVSAFKPFVRVAKAAPERSTARLEPLDFPNELSRILDGQSSRADENPPLNPAPWKRVRNEPTGLPPAVPDPDEKAEIEDAMSILLAMQNTRKPREGSLTVA